MNENLERMKEILKYDFPYPRCELSEYESKLLIAINGLGKMLVEFACMIEKQTQYENASRKIDKLIEQTNQRVKDVKPPKFD